MLRAAVESGVVLALSWRRLQLVYVVVVVVVARGTGEVSVSGGEKEGRVSYVGQNYK